MPKLPPECIRAYIANNQRADCRHLQLLRACGERPRRRTAEKRDEVAPSCLEHATLPLKRGPVVTAAGATVLAGGPLTLQLGAEQLPGASRIVLKRGAAASCPRQNYSTLKCGSRQLHLRDFQSASCRLGVIRRHKGPLLSCPLFPR